MREALGKAAGRERRSVASLLGKIITDYLEKEGFPLGADAPLERRRFPRKKITIPGTTKMKINSHSETFPAVILDISPGGALLTYPKGSDVTFKSFGELPSFELSFKLPGSGEEISLNCDARRIVDVGNEIQVGSTFQDSSHNDLSKLEAYLH